MWFPYAKKNKWHMHLLETLTTLPTVGIRLKDLQSPIGSHKRTLNILVVSNNNKNKNYSFIANRSGEFSTILIDFNTKKCNFRF